MKRLNGAGTRALDVVKQFTIAQRTIAIIGVAVLMLGGIALTSYLAKPTYEVLYSNISAANASAVTAQLDKDKVQFQLEDGGTTILVPANSVDSERLATASMLSSGAGGYSLLDNMGVTASEFQQNVTYKRAIEGELAKTIGSLDGVSLASVQLAIPQQSVFSDNKEEPKASVFVNVSSPLSNDQVNAIVHLVAAAYPGLTTDNVTVTDQNGDLLSAGGVTGGSSSDTAAQYEATTRAKVQEMLDKVLGPGNAVVTVAADMSDSSGTKQSESYSVPSQAPAFSEASTGTPASATGGTTGQSGVLGADTTDTTTKATTSGTGTGSGTGSGSGTSNSVVKNNALNKTTLTESIVPGTLTRQTIAVALNTKVAGLITTSALNQLVTNAAGVNLTRGDNVSVTQVAFSNAAAKTAAAALAQAQKVQGASQMTELITTAIKVVGGLVLFFLVVTMLRKLFKRQDPIVAGPINLVPQNGYIGDPTVQLGSLGTPTAVYGMPNGMAPAGELVAPADPAFAQLQADVDALAGSDPEQTAEYLRALMGDRAGV